MEETVAEGLCVIERALHFSTGGRRYRLRNRATASIHGSTPKPCNLF